MEHISSVSIKTQLEPEFQHTFTITYLVIKVIIIKYLLIDVLQVPVGV